MFGVGEILSMLVIKAVQLFQRAYQNNKVMFESYPPTSKDSLELLSLFQTQKRICDQYVKIAAYQLYSKQAQTISTANDLLQKISNREVVKDLSEWDVFSTRDSVIVQDDNSFNLSGLSFQSRGRKIQRKSARTARTSRQMESTMNECLAQIEQQCTDRTLTTVKKVVDEYRKLKQRIFELQKKEKTAKAKDKLIDELQQKLAVLDRRNQDIEYTLQKLKVDNASLKASNLELNDLIHKKNSEINTEKKIKIFEEIISHQSSSSLKISQSPNNSSIDIVSDMLKEKENLINLRQEQIRKIEERVEHQLFDRQDTCLKCCELLRKIKTSISSYKQYLEKEATEFEKIVDNFKAKMLEKENIAE